MTNCLVNLSLPESCCDNANKAGLYPASHWPRALSVILTIRRGGRDNKQNMKTNTYNMDGNALTFETGVVVTFDFPIKKALVANNTIVILIDPPFNTIYNHNVFGISLTGDFIWRMRQVELYYWGSNNCPYVDVIVNEDKEIVLFNWCDTAVIISPQTGEVIRTYQTK
jgi:hypothetical protein